MRAQCCICADLFENSSDINIAAAPCGHTFHELCLMQWLEKSSTCPSCRIQVKKKQVLKRLYFDIREDDEAEADPSELVNQNGTLRAQVGQLTKDKKDLAEERDGLAVALAKSASDYNDMTLKVKGFENEKGLVSRELAAKEKVIATYKRELRDYVDTQKKLKQLQHLSALLSDSSEESQELNFNFFLGGGEKSVQQLTEMLTVVRREYKKAMGDKKNLREQLVTKKTEVDIYKEKYSRVKNEMKDLQKRSEKSDQEIFSLERENNLKRRKIAHLRSALKDDKTEGSQSFIAAISEDSPNVAYSPLLVDDLKDATDSMKAASPDASLADRLAELSSPDLFNDTGDDDPQTRTEEDSKSGMAGISDTPVLKKVASSFPSASEKFVASKRAKMEQEKDMPPPPPFSNYGILRKKLMGVTGYGSGLSTRAFDGFGGSRRVEMDAPLGPSKNALLKFGPKKQTRKRNPLLPKGQVEKPVPVDRLFKGKGDSSPYFVPIPNESSSSSSSVETAAKKKNKLTCRSTDIINMFAKAHKPVLGKHSTRTKDDVIILTDSPTSSKKSARGRVNDVIDLTDPAL